MLRAEGISKTFGGAPLFQDATFQLNKGERCALVGRNGSGKSTLMKILLGLVTADQGSVTTPKNYSLGYLEQHIAFTRPTVREEATLALPEEERITPYRAEAILSGLGFSEEDFDKPPSSFSGGYQLRIQLAKTLIREPDCLLLDEPTNYLDVVSIGWLTRFLCSWKGEMILISHDRAFLDALSTHTMGIHRKKFFRKEGKSRDFYDSLLQYEEIHEKTRQKIDKQVAHAEDFIKRFGAKATKAKQAQSRRKAIQKLPSLEKLASIEGLDFSFHAAPFPGRRFVHVEEVDFRYPGMDEPLIENFSCEIEPGDRIAIIGKNGRGKSTLLRLLAGDLQPTKGKISFAENVSIGYFGQTNVQKLNPSLSVEEEIALSNPALPYGEIRNICGMMMFSGKDAEKKIQILSGGEKSRVLLGKILATSCNLLLLDEPTNHLDIESVEALLEALEEFPGAVIIVSHGEEILSRLPDKMIICRQGRQEMFLGDYSYFLEKGGWEEPSEKKEPERKERKKDDKRKRAEIVQERSKALSPIKKKIQAKEKEIIDTEVVLEDLNVSLQEAIERQDHSAVAKATRRLGETQKACDLLYEELESLYEELESAALPFEEWPA